jgi:hypothetical protein
VVCGEMVLSPLLADAGIGGGVGDPSRGIDLPALDTLGCPNSASVLSTDSNMRGAREDHRDSTSSPFQGDETKLPGKPRAARIGHQR